MNEVTPRRPSFLQEGEYFSFAFERLEFLFLNHEGVLSISIAAIDKMELVPEGVLDRADKQVHLFQGSRNDYRSDSDFKNATDYADTLYDEIALSVSGQSSRHRDFLLPEKWSSPDRKARREWWK